MKTKRRALLALLTLCAASCEDAQAPPARGWVAVELGEARMEYSIADEAIVESMKAMADGGAVRVGSFFGRSLGRGYTVRISPNRASLESDWAARFGTPAGGLQCWMIANADADFVLILSPRVWATQACGHSATDEAAVAGVLAHELVHVLHRRLNPDPRLSALAGAWWFYEGLAELASGRYGDAQVRQVRESLRTAPPRELEQLLGSNAGYAVAGSLAWYIDEIYGRESVVQLLRARTEAEILTGLGSSEAALLAAWIGYVLGTGDGVVP